MFSINEIAYEESRLINIAEYEYGEYFKTAVASVTFLWQFYEKPSPDGLVFLRFLSQVQKSVYLSLLSILRKHDIQTNMMIRYTLESAALALYSMFNKDEEKYRKYMDDGTVYPIKMLDNAYKWLGKEFPDYNRSMKVMKDTTNYMSTHGNITASALNTSFDEDDRITVHMFDLEHKEITKTRLFWISDICFGFINTVAKNNLKYPIIKLISDFDNTMYSLYKMIKIIEKDLKESEMYKKFENEQKK